MKSEAPYLQQNKPAETHFPFIPQEIRANDPIKAIMTIDSRDYNLDVWKLSPFGIELVTDKSFKLITSKLYKIRVAIGGEYSVLDGVLMYEYNHNDKIIVCIRFTNEKKPYNNIERRAKSRWNCSSQYFPTGMANSPAKFNDFIYFKIRDISFGGMKIVCSLRNKFLLPGMNLNAMINFPMVSQMNVKLKIENLNIGTEEGKEVISMGVTYDTSDPNLIEVISNYLLQFSNISTFQDLRDEGFVTKKLSSSIDFSYVKSKEDFQDCLKLRLMANQAAQKLKDDTKMEDMTDEYDSRSRIIIGKHAGNTVCTVRMAFHELDDRMEIEKHTILPDSFPRRDEVIEIMRLCTHPSYRGSDLLNSLFKHLAIVVVQSKRKYIVTSCVESLKPLYKRIGFKEAGITYENPLFKGFPDQVMIANVETLLLGKDINPLIWNLVWGDLYNYFENYDLVSYTPMEKIRIKVLKKLKPLAHVMANYSSRKVDKK